MDINKKETENIDDVPISVEIRQIDQRIKNVETIVETVKDISNNAIELLTTYLSQKDASEKRQSEFNDRQHKRNIYMLIIVISVISILSMTALLLKEIDLVKYFIGSGIAVAAGSGIKAMLSNDSRAKKNAN